MHECIHKWIEGTGSPDAKHAKDGATATTFDGKHPWPNGKATNVAGEILGTTIHEGDQPRWYRWDLKTEAIQAWISGSRPNYGFVVMGTPDGKAVSFTAKESTAGERRPILRLTLSLPDADVAKLGALAVSDIAWPQFVADCGKSAQEANEARTEKVFEDKYLGRTVNWTGTVEATKRNPIGTGYSVFVRMDPTEVAFGTFDLMLLAPDSLTDRILALNKGQRVDFAAEFIRQGGHILGHTLELLTIEPAKPPVQPQRKGVTSPRRKRRR